MKNGLTAIQFSGYPLKLADSKKESGTRRHNLFVVKAPQAHCFQSLFQVHQMVKNPVNWDADWFSSYE